ncbi:hypothetical protein [Flavobacterium sp.]|uniref:hypothetical protein n=1 Tax=Flavobacterium sp. TaxID=239 RepID=UPI003264A2C2
MLKKILLASLFLNGLISFSQEIVSSTPINLKKNRDVFQTLNEDKKEVTLFISDKIKVNALRLNEKMEVIDSLSAERPIPKTYTNMIGYNLNNDNTRLFWSSNDYEEIFTQLFDLKTREVITKQYSLILKEEKILQKFSGKENFYILSVLKKGNSLKLHIFDKEGTYTQKTIDFNSFRFLNSDNIKSDLYGVLKENLLPFEAPLSMQSINVKNPTSLTDSAKKRKCYFNDKQITITIDTNVDYTQVFIIDLETFSVTEKIVRQHSISGDRFYLSSNSFYFENKLYQVKTSMDQFYFSIKDLDNTLIKEYDASSEKQIDFKNSEMSLEGSDFGGKRTLTNSSQFIRKINNLNLGISCYHIGQNTLIAFGGVSSEQQSAGQTTMSQFGLIGALVSLAISNPTMESFNSYSNRKVVKIEGLFDNEGNHIKGELQPLAFDKIRTYFDKNNDVSSQTLFKMGNFYNLGYYDNKTKEYIFRKFAD